ncbi:glycoside hydrolase family 19 protein [Methylobacter tundripaludum]|uniref:glycoside hydrolase family 19 protein n=1 Tax=Methylobacter tundripaludum TaxID=173365 RepID=UPI000567F717|nr:glycoside hydrolase family 19 protein [Methylobacter tundripaludum]
MALQHDERGFLTGNPIDLGRMPKYLLDIKGDVAAIKRAVVGTAANTPRRTAVNPPVGRSSAVINVPMRSRTSDHQRTIVERIRAVSNYSAVALPGRNAHGRFVSGHNDNVPSNRDTSGRFTRGGESDGAVTTLANRLSALSGIGSGLVEADPTVKAFQEIAEPMKRGLELFGGGDKKERWFRKIFGELKLFHRDETVFSRASSRSLHNIEGNPGGNGGGDNSGIMAILAARLGPALLAGITAVLGFIFSPIGLAIGAASAVAWGLFTESGQKFFGEVGAKIIAGWDGVVSAFAPVTESISKGWDTVKGGFDSLIGGMVSSWDAFTGFLKDKFGIDIPAIFKPVVDVSKKVVETATEAVKGSANIAKETASKAVDAVAKSSPKTTEALGKGWDKVTEGAGKIMSHATGKTAANKAAMLNEMAAQGITDPNEQAMLMAEVDHESGGFTSTREKSHTRASTVMAVSKTARKAGLPTVEAAVAQGGDAVAELMYGGRMGNTEKGDGAKFKGRGLIQLTGKDNYAAASKDLGIDLVNHPELAETPDVAAKTAMWFWKKNKLGDSAKKGDVRTNRHGVNGGEIGLAEVEKKRDKYLVDANNGDFNVSPAEAKPAVASISDDPTQGGRYKYETLEGGKVQVTDNESGTIELASDEQANAYRKQQGKPYLDKVAAINSGDMSMYNRLAAGPVNTASMVSAPVPSAPVMPTSPKIAEAPPVIEPLSSPEQRPIMVSVAAMDATQDVSDKRIAHIASGGISS